MPSTSITHTTIGVWDLYEQDKSEPKAVPSVVHNLPYVWRMLTDIASIRECWIPFAAYLVIEIVSALVPALSLSYSGQLLDIVHTAVEHRTVDTRLLVKATLGRFACRLASGLLRHAQQKVTRPLLQRIKTYYSVHIFGAFVRLDVPTFDDPAVQRQIEDAVPSNSHTNSAFLAVTGTVKIITTALELSSQLFVLLDIFNGDPDNLLIALLNVAYAYTQWYGGTKNYISQGQGVWAATTTDTDYIRSEGLKRAVADPIHRKEIVAAGIAPVLLAQYREAVSRISDRAGDFYSVVDDYKRNRALPIKEIFQELLHGLPLIVFTLRAVQQPTSIPVSLASFNLITSQATSFTYTAITLYDSTGSITQRLTAVRHLYDVAKIPNRIQVRLPPAQEKEKVREGFQEPFVGDPDDETVGVPFPEDQRSLELGISVEFRRVSFKYPGSDIYALRNTSFKIERGQLCVIVGNNGSGKSTILKLIARLYDPSEGEIWINDRDIRTLRLADLRKAISVLFQDYTVFPLSIRDNIALGAPAPPSTTSSTSTSLPSPSPCASDLDKIQQAAQLGGASSFIARLPAGYDTYLDRPVQDYYSKRIEGGKDLLGRAAAAVDYEGVREAGGMGQAEGGGGVGFGGRGVSGGQKQRIALSRMFMRSVVADESVGLLLFDEPSASLDPTAEHGSSALLFSSLPTLLLKVNTHLLDRVCADLFERLRKLRGNKTMIFSSHRFGNLTRHADLILYMNDSVVLEEGTHEQLLRKNGEYARIWMLQAQAFL
ncbi:P-loop containing nucleoside triphosphate hydrolase protein [Crassisporium funariophilum]|nr:P-loop containing nucleoside triphosphate hydrolase protein [Crassisporium funariophilum]